MIVLSAEVAVPSVSQFDLEKKNESEIAPVLISDCTSARPGTLACDGTWLPSTTHCDTRAANLVLPQPALAVTRSKSDSVPSYHETYSEVLENHRHACLEQLSFSERNVSWSVGSRLARHASVFSWSGIDLLGAIDSRCSNLNASKVNPLHLFVSARKTQLKSLAFTVKFSKAFLMIGNSSLTSNNKNVLHSHHQLSSQNGKTHESTLMTHKTNDLFSLSSLSIKSTIFFSFTKALAALPISP